MDAKTPQPDVKAIAAEVIATIGTGGAIAPFSSRQDKRTGDLTPGDAKRVRPLLRAAFEARGETIVGRKIGFTNRGIWAQYGVDAPNWGYVTDHTVHDLEADGILPLASFSEPRIEPEIMFGLKAAPSRAISAATDDAALLDYIDWVALGFEIVQSIYPGWKFSLADTVAANGLHGALLIGERHQIAPRNSEWLRELASFELELLCDGRAMDRGGGAEVLEGPLSTLRYLAGVLAQDPPSPAIAPGEIISTGTLTKALPVKAGETWSAKVTGIALSGISLRFE